ncbi:hypothetical protein B0H13DRAFT_2291337 [Mycena leptocephala]|nr:hypothetical protein B0H13DRAFT_2291337 [Mycena leptocephala]
MLLGTFCSLLNFFGLWTLFGDLNEDPLDGVPSLEALTWGFLAESDVPEKFGPKGHRNDHSTKKNCVDRNTSDVHRKSADQTTSRWTRFPGSRVDMSNDKGKGRQLLTICPPPRETPQVTAAYGSCAQRWLSSSSETLSHLLFRYIPGETVGYIEKFHRLIQFWPRARSKASNSFPERGFVVGVLYKGFISTGVKTGYK